jgi:hypothetical protein
LSILCSTLATVGTSKITTHTVKYNIFRQAEHISNVQFSPGSHPQQETVQVVQIHHNEKKFVMTTIKLRDQYSRNMNTGMEKEHHICTKIMMN